MSNLAKHRVLVSFVAAAFILLLAIGAIFWARGFKVNLKNGKIERTGLLVVASTPTGAQVFLDDRLTSVTDTNIAFLEPKTYIMRIQKDGYTAWQKEIEIKADLATEIKALLFPQAPEIKPLTNTGSASPVLSPDGSKIVYGVGGERGGLYLMPLSDSPLAFRQSPRLLVRNQVGLDFTKAKFLWGPDSKQLIARFEEEQGIAIANLLIDAEKTEQEVRDITGSLLATLNRWQQDLDARSQTQASVIPQSVKEATVGAKFQVASPSPSPRPRLSQTAQQPASPIFQLNYYPTGLIFSPDEEKILYQTKDGKYRVYDLKRKKEFTLPDLPDLVNISWFPDSEHLVIAQNNLISIIETDGQNKVTVFSGKFENGFVFAHPSATRLIVLTTLTQQEGSLPNLYAVNLK